MKSKIIFLLLFISISCFGQENKVLNVTLTKPGTILNYIDFNSIQEITDLTISGIINKTDLEVIKKMEKLKLLNISNTTIQYNKEALAEKIRGLDYSYMLALNLVANMGKQLSPKEKQKLKIELDSEILKVTKLYKSGGVFEESLFKEFGSLETIYLPKSIQVIEEEAFNNCKNLCKVIFPEYLISIGAKAFQNCNNLKEIYLSSNVKKIEYSAFENCIELEKVIIKSNLQEIDRNCFSGCTKLRELSIFGALEISSSFTCGCDSLKAIYCFSKTPPKVARYDYCSLGRDYIRKDIVFYFPKVSVTSYFVSEWADFFTIKAE